MVALQLLKDANRVAVSCFMQSITVATSWWWHEIWASVAYPRNVNIVLEFRTNLLFRSFEMPLAIIIEYSVSSCVILVYLCVVVRLLTIEAPASVFELSIRFAQNAESNVETKKIKFKSF